METNGNITPVNVAVTQQDVALNGKLGLLNLGAHAYSRGKRARVLLLRILILAFRSRKCHQTHTPHDLHNTHTHTHTPASPPSSPSSPPILLEEIEERVQVAVVWPETE